MRRELWNGNVSAAQPALRDEDVNVVLWAWRSPGNTRR